MAVCVPQLPSLPGDKAVGAVRAKGVGGMIGTRGMDGRSSGAWVVISGIGHGEIEKVLRQGLVDPLFVIFFPSSVLHLMRGFQSGRRWDALAIARLACSLSASTSLA